MTDAQSFLLKLTRNRIWWGLLVFMALEPTIGAIIPRLFKHSWWLGDFDAITCAAQTLATGHSPYTPHPACLGMRAASYVYTPLLADGLVPLVRALGAVGMHWAYGLILAPLTLLILWYAVLKPFPNGPIHLRLMSLMAIPGSPLITGNVGAVLHGLVIATVLKLQRLRGVFVAVVIACALVKPFFLAALIVLLFENRPFRARLTIFIPAVIIGGIAVAGVFTANVPYAADWHHLFDLVVLHNQPGRGLFGLFSFLGLNQTTPLAYAIIMLFAAVIVTGGLIIAEGGDLNDDERILLGLGVAALINPRLFEYDYDLYLLFPAMALVVMTAQKLDARIFVYLSWAFVITMFGRFWISILGIRLFQAFPGTFLILTTIFLTVAIRIAHQKDYLTIAAGWLTPMRSDRATR